MAKLMEIPRLYRRTLGIILFLATYILLKEYTENLFIVVLTASIFAIAAYMLSGRSFYRWVKRRIEYEQTEDELEEKEKK